MTTATTSDAADLLLVERSRIVGGALAAQLAQRSWTGIVRTVRRFDPADPDPVDLVLISADDPAARALPEVVARARPDARVVVVSVPDAEPDIVRWAELGVAGILTESDGLDDLEAVATAIASGRSACSVGVASVLLQQFALRARDRVEADPAPDIRLTPREREVLALIELGWSNQQIARRLSIEVRTVKNHVHNLFEKLRVRRRSEAAVWRHRSQLDAARREPARV